METPPDCPGGTAPAAGDAAPQGQVPNQGLSMVARFRAERLANTARHRQTLRAARSALKDERATRLGLKPETPPLTPALATPLPLPGPAPETEAPASVFAQFVASELQAARDAAPASPAETPAPADDTPCAHAEPHAEPAPAPAPASEPPALAAAEPPAAPPTPEPALAAPQAPAPICPDLTALGFGPGMTARLNHLGIVSVTDLAGADTASLRAALGDVGDLVNVDHWVGQARALLRHAA